ncbi:MAG: sodium:solute symporter [Bacillota bacterium]|nr:sodium:solute symporter [Bacillota bacterium]
MKILVVFLYALMVLSLGYVGMKKTKTVNDFFLGDRALGPWVSAFAYGTSYFSAVLFIGYAGKVGWGFGLSALWIVVGNAFVGSYLAWRVLGLRTRVLTARLNALTMPEFFEARYDSKAFKIASGLIIFVFMVPYSASVYMGLSYLFEQVFNIPYLAALILMALLTGIYLTMGGYLAIALADLVQGVIMIIGVILLVFFVINAPQIGGISPGIERLANINPQLVAPVGPPGVIPLVALVVLTSLGSWGLPQMVQKFYSIKSESDIPKATVMATIFAILMTFGAYFTGSLSRLFFPEGLPLVNGLANYDLIIPKIITMALPEIVAMVILLLVLSASMSTLASLVLVSSSSIAIDLIKGGLFPYIGKDKLVLLMRIFCVCFIIFSLFLAITPTPILSLMAISWGTLAGSFLAPYFYGLFWRGTTKTGAFAGMLTGLSISVIFSFYYGVNSPHIPLIGSIAIVVPLIVVPIVSLFTKGYSEEHISKVFGTKQHKFSNTTDGEVVTNDLG